MDQLTEVVEGVENNIKGLEPFDVELGFLDIRVDRLNAHVWEVPAVCAAIWDVEKDRTLSREE